MAVIAFSAVGASASGDLAGFATTPHGSLLEHLRALGHELVEPGDDRATHFVGLDHNAGSLAAASAVPVANRVLVVYEPRVVLPANYRRSVRAQYGRVIPMAVVPQGDGLPWPQRDWTALPPATTVPRVAGTTAIINANKLSSVRGSLYGLRRRVIAQFDRDRLPLTLAGGGWDRRGRALLVENARAIAYALYNRVGVDLREWARPLPLDGTVDYIGRIDDKDDVLLASEFAVVIENSATYVSEKLFDAVIAGCVPLYVGPPLGDYGIPDSVAVTLPPRSSAFTAAVRELDTERKNAVLAAGRAWLADNATHATWAMPAALGRLAAEIDRFTSTREEES